MSKRERLEKQKLKQLEQKRLDELEEQKAKDNAKKNKSKTALKSKKVILKPKENAGFLFAKIVMTVVLVYSCVFYGLITIIGILKGYINMVSNSYAIIFGVGSFLTAVGVIIAYFKKYYASFILVLAGVITYMKGALHIINIISDKLENYDGASPSISRMDKTYMIRYYPILIILIISFVLALITLIKFIKKKRKLKEERDNAPVKSIIG